MACSSVGPRWKAARPRVRAGFLRRAGRIPDTTATGADAGQKRAKADKTVVETQVLANTPNENPNSGEDPELEHAKAEHEAGLAERDQQHKERMDFMNHGLKREVETNKLRLQAQDMAAKRMDARAAAQAQAATAAQKPQPQRQGLR